MWLAGGGVTVGELRTDVGSFEVHFRNVEKDGGVCEDQEDVEWNGPSDMVLSRLGSGWKVVSINGAASRVVAVPVVMLFFEKGLSIHVSFLLW